MTKEMGIGEVARQAGIRSSAIRYYESMQVLPPPRLVSKKRRYTNDIFLRLSLIKIAQEAGFTVAEMRFVLNSQEGDAQLPGGWRMLAQQKLVEVKARIKQLETMRYILEEALRQEHLSIEEAIYLFQPLVQGSSGNAKHRER
ncbi:MAG TPA: MerR family transcriptional regulator [Ktedonobacteraceae bacterium]|jgi:MerR family transcriptional regulator, redox-sensitive transcriptional activator SoxR